MRKWNYRKYLINPKEGRKEEKGEHIPQGCKDSSIYSNQSM